MTLIPALLSLDPSQAACRGGAGATQPRAASQSFFTPAALTTDSWRAIGHRKASGSSSAPVREPFWSRAFGLTAQSRVDSDFRGMFPDDNPTMSDFKWIESIAWVAWATWRSCSTCNRRRIGSAKLTLRGGRVSDSLQLTLREAGSEELQPAVSLPRL